LAVHDEQISHVYYSVVIKVSGYVKTNLTGAFAEALLEK
jgi:hypothetical protein